MLASGKDVKNKKAPGKAHDDPAGAHASDLFPLFLPKGEGYRLSIVRSFTASGQKLQIHIIWYVSSIWQYSINLRIHIKIISQTQKSQLRICLIKLCFLCKKSSKLHISVRSFPDERRENHKSTPPAILSGRSAACGSR